RSQLKKRQFWAALSPIPARVCRGSTLWEKFGYPPEPATASEGFVQWFQTLFLLYYAAMSLASGTRLGPYEILDAIGAGGMGEVTHDGKRVLLPISVTDASPPLSVVTNWKEALKR